MKTNSTRYLIFQPSRRTAECRMQNAKCRISALPRCCLHTYTLTHLHTLLHPSSHPPIHPNSHPFTHPPIHPSTRSSFSLLPSPFSLLRHRLHTHTLTHLHTYTLALALLLVTLPAARAAGVVILTAPLTSESSGLGETSLGDLVADAVRQSGNAQLGLVDSESLRPIRLQGAVKVDQFLTALNVPADPIVVMTVHGEVIKAALERSVSNLPQSSPGFLQVSGITYVLTGGARTGARISGIRIGGAALSPAANYSVAMPQSLAQGANGYFLVWPAGAASRPANVKMGEGLTAYVSRESSLSPSPTRVARE